MDLSVLNTNQKEAVITTEGPVMVMAGAGSGKTRVLTYRIAYLISELGINPTNILAVTFTNKAAREMKERVEKMLNMNVNHLWISTFHSFCARFLRREIRWLNLYKNDFVIIDEDDAIKILKEEMKDKEFMLTPKEAMSFISLAKNHESLPDMETNERKEFETIYSLYQNHLIKENLLDFDDLILLTVKVLEENPHVLDKYQRQFSYIMIDEFQDTNKLQYKLINLLTNTNIFIVGDINQSIYSFRGARVENIEYFKKEYKPKIIKLEKNYRSTSMILDIANDVIRKNQSYSNMHLYTDNETGSKAEFFRADSNYGEVLHICNEIKKLHRLGYKYKDMAILYRVNSLSLNFENEFVKANIPYVIYGGVGYFERKEVKDIIAYLRVIVNQDDDFSFKRIVNVPRRKVGNKLIETLTEIATSYDCSMFDAITYVNNASLNNFRKLILDFNEKLEKETLVNLLDLLINQSGYLAMLEADDEEDRIDNVMELKSIMKDISESYEGSNKEKLQNFLMDLALRTDVDNVDESDDKVKLMSFHQAKGLEYKVVFMPAMEEGIFPSFRSMGSSFELEEERRICYVGITRAQEKLYFSMAKLRRMYGKDNPGFQSQFMKSINKDRIIETGIDVRPTTTFNTFNSFKPEVKKEKEDKSLRVGSKIRHKVFGDGVVVACDGNKITVAFSKEFGIRTLMADHPSITRI